MKKELLLLPLFSLSILGCSKSSTNLWNRTLKSTGKTVLNYTSPIDANHPTKIIDFLKNNFDNINWETSGVRFDFWGDVIIDYFYPDDYSSFDNLKNTLDNWWDLDRQFDPTLTYWGLKNRINHITTKIKKKDKYTGTVTFHSNINPNKPTDTTFLATDISEKHNGSYLLLNLPGKDPVGYVRYSGFKDIINIRNGYNDDSMIQFTFTLKEETEGLTEFHLNSYIEIKDPEFKMPWWGIFLIVFGSVVLVGTIYLIIKQYRRNHHKY